MWTACTLPYSARLAGVSPVPGGIGVVGIVLIAALASACVRAPTAVTATLLYRLLSVKIGISMIWFAHHFWQRRRARTGRRGASPPSGHPVPLPAEDDRIPAPQTVGGRGRRRIWRVISAPTRALLCCFPGDALRGW